jgi:DNA-directed RNA polymerase I, II, and III subunit RPABC1
MQHSKIQKLVPRFLVYESKMEVTPELSLYRSFRTVCEMMADRKYEVPEEIADLDYESFVTVYITDSPDQRGQTSTFRESRDNMTTIFTKGQKKVVVFWIETCGTADVQKLKKRMDDIGVSHSIAVIGNNKITTTGATTLKFLATGGTIIETFFESSLQYNITRHIYQPRFVVCPRETKNKILAAYCVTESQIPKIQSSDPISRYHAAKPGTLFKIVRPSESMPYVMVGEEKKVLYDIYYRIVSG